MDPATQAKLFQVVSEGDSSMTRRFGGTGPALPSPNDSSTAWADTSTYRVGPTKARNSVSNSPGPSQRPTPDIPVRRCFPRPPSLAGPVLVVADDHVNQCVIELLLQKTGLSCVVVSDSASAVELARIQPWDATLMDDARHGRVRSDAQIRRLLADRFKPIIALTANAMTGDREDCVNAGMGDFLAKPVRQEELQVCLERRLKMPGC